MGSIGGAPTADELGTYLRGLLIRLTSLDSQLEDNKGMSEASLS